MDAVCALAAIVNSFAFDYLARQKYSGNHLSTFVIEQMPVPSPADIEQFAPRLGGPQGTRWIVDRVLELSFTAWDIREFAKDCGYEGSPFQWNSLRRALLKAELDAAVFHLYGFSRSQVENVMASFLVIRDNEFREFGAYRSRDFVLDRYDAMAEVFAAGQTYTSPVTPKPCDPSVAHRSEGSRDPEAPSPGGKLLSFRRIDQPRPIDHYRTCVPLYALKVAAGHPDEFQFVEESTWVEQISTRRTLGPGMFVAQVEGDSMEPRVPSGSYCLFGPPPVDADGEIVLAELRQRRDLSEGGWYLLKRFRRSSGGKAELLSLNRKYPPRILRIDDEMAVKGVLLDVLGAQPEAAEATAMTVPAGRRLPIGNIADYVKEPCEPRHRR